MAIGCLVTLATVGPAHAGDPTADQPAPKPSKGGGSGDGFINSHIKLSRSSNNTSSGTPVTAAVANWSPPPCWYEPEYTPDEYEKFIKTAYHGALEPAASYAKKRDAEEYHKGDKGLWWKITFPNDDYTEACPVTTDNWELWVPPANPRPDPNEITPEKLSELALSRTKLPAPPVTLRPDANRLIVNLPTQVSFQGALDRAWTTASLDYKGVRMAATTVATPVALKVDAGTSDADPQTCAYNLVKGKGGYHVDSAKAGCNVTYLHSSGTGTYPFKASLTWHVTWTASADPDGPPQQPALPDGLSTFEQNVTVKEIQAINR